MFWTNNSKFLLQAGSNSDNGTQEWNTITENIAILHQINYFGFTDERMSGRTDGHQDLKDRAAIAAQSRLTRILPSDVVEVGVFQEVVSVQVVEGEGEERGRDQPLGGHLQQGPPPRPTDRGLYL